MLQMNEEISELKSELEKTRNMVRIQRLRYQQLVSLFSVKLQEREEEARGDLQAKHMQLTRILRSLYVLESKLRKEQRVLKTTLSERDALIKTQQTEIVELKSQLEKIVEQCVCAQKSTATELLQKSEPCDSPVDNKPDLISSIGIEALKQSTNHPQTTENSAHIPIHHEVCENRLVAESSTVIIPSLDGYDVNSTTLHVKEPTFSESLAIQDGSVNNNTSRNSICSLTDETLHSGEVQNSNSNFNHEINDNNTSLPSADSKDYTDDHIHPVKEPAGHQYDSPRQILKEVTENHDKLNGPVLKCVQQILSLDSTTDHHQTEKPNKPSVASKVPVLAHRNGRYHPTKPPKPVLKAELVASETITIPSRFLNTPNNGSSLTVKPLPKSNGCNETSLDDHSEDQQWATDTSLESNDEEVLNGGVFKSKRSSDPSDESKIVQTVSALLSDSDDSDEDENNVEISPTVSQMVKKFEGMRSRKNVSNSKHSSKGKYIHRSFCKTSNTYLSLILFFNSAAILRYLGICLDKKKSQVGTNKYNSANF